MWQYKIQEMNVELKMSQGRQERVSKVNAKGSNSNQHFFHPNFIPQFMSVKPKFPHFHTVSHRVH